jgi:hypothetical protein
LITPKPEKKPKAANICFAAEHPTNVQTDSTHYWLTEPAA